MAAGWARAGPPPAGNPKAGHPGPAPGAARARFWAAYQLPGRAGTEGTAAVAAAAAASAGAPALSIGLQHRGMYWVRAARPKVALHVARGAAALSSDGPGDRGTASGVLKAVVRLLWGHWCPSATGLSTAAGRCDCPAAQTAA